MGTGGMGAGGAGGMAVGGAGGMGAGGEAGSGQGGMGVGGAGGMGTGGAGGMGMGGSGGMGGNQLLCGNGMLDAGEGCDDGNTQMGDGCSANCQFDAVCGNGKKESGEACDDGNMVSGDGCSATCLLEMSSVCSSAIDLQNPMLVTKDGEVTTYDGTTTGSMLVNFSNPSCSVGTTGVPTRLHRYRTVPTLSRLIAKTMPIDGPMADPVLWMFSDCLNPTMETACNDDSGSGKHPKLRSPVLAPSTDVTFALAGHNASDVGPYQLVLTEQPLVPLPTPGTCAAPRTVGEGHYLVTTSGAGTHKGSCTGTGAPEAVLSLALAQKSDVRIHVTPENPNLDVGVYVRANNCNAINDIGCAEAGSAGQTETLVLRDLNPANYSTFIDGFTAQDAGQVQVDIDITPVISAGQPCDVLRRDNRCVTTASCVGPVGAGICKTHTVISANTFDTSLAPATVVDIFSDGNGWGHCDPVLGCTQDNTTESLSGGGYALIKDKANASLDGEILRLPQANGSGYQKVLLSFYHDFDHWDGSTDVGRIEVSKDAVTWTPVVSYTRDNTGWVVLDISSIAAGSSFYVQFVYDDQTAGGDSYTEEWRVDDVRLLGIP